MGAAEAISRPNTPVFGDTAASAPVTIDAALPQTPNVSQATDTLQPGATHSPAQSVKGAWRNVCQQLNTPLARTIACGVAGVAVAATCAPVSWPTTHLVANRIVLGAVGGGVMAGAAHLRPDLPLRLLGAAFGVLVGAAFAMASAPCMSALYLTSAVFISGAIGFEGIMHLEAIKNGLLGATVIGLGWWAATILGPKVGVAVPGVAFAA